MRIVLVLFLCLLIAALALHGQSTNITNNTNTTSKISDSQNSPKPLSAEEKELYNLGKETYTLTCGACHQPHGLGMEALAPPLVDSDWVTGSEQRLARIILQGLRGPVTVKGKEWNMEMPRLDVLEDKQIAAIMTYIRREWNHTASPITEGFVKKVREETSTRDEPWSEEELLKIK